jgi:hypothetical protein
VLFERSSSGSWIRDSSGRRVSYSGELATSEGVLPQLVEPHLFPELSTLRMEIGGWPSHHLRRAQKPWVPQSSQFLPRPGNEACTPPGIKAACATRTLASSRYLDFAWDASARLAFRRTAQTPYKQSVAASSMSRRRIHWLGPSHQQLITNGQPRSSTHDRLESCSTRNSRQPVEQTNYDRKGKQAESGIPINSPFIEVNVRTLHALSLHPAIPLVCDGRYTCCSVFVGRSYLSSIQL